MKLLPGTVIGVLSIDRTRMYFYICLSFLNQFNKCHVQWSFIFIKEVFGFFNSSWGKITTFSVVFGLFFNIVHFLKQKLLPESGGFIRGTSKEGTSFLRSRAQSSFTVDSLLQRKFISLDRVQCVPCLLKSLFLDTISHFTTLHFLSSHTERAPHLKSHK